MQLSVSCYFLTPDAAGNLLCMIATLSHRPSAINHAL